MISALLIYGQRGEVLASRVYKDGLRRAVTDTFRIQVIANPENQTPLLTLGSTSFLHIRHKNLYIVAVTRHNVDTALVYEFLYKLCAILQARFGEFDETSCYKNVSQIYEILDELVDFGYPQVTELGVLKQYLSDGSQSLDNGTSDSGIVKSSGGGIISSLTRKNSTAVGRGPSSSVPWRPSDIRHRRNEAYIDVLENLYMVIDPAGKVLSAAVEGRIQMKAKLSGVPDCRIALTDSTLASYEPSHETSDKDNSLDGGDDESEALERFEDCQLHECVNLRRFQSSHTIAFVPPEGEFELLRYRVTKDISMPFELRNEVINGDTHVIHLRCTLDSKQHAINVSVHIPTFDTDPHKFKGSTGKARYNAGESRVEWKIGRISGGHEANLRLPLRLDSQGRNSNAKMAPITMNFQINMYTCSGLKIKYLRVVDDSKYATLKWVRYLTKDGTCEARVPV